MLTGKKVIIFDLDGTLIDSVGVWNQVDEELIRQIRSADAPHPENVQQQRDEALRRFSKAENPYLEYCAFLKETYGASQTPEEIHALRYEIAQDFLRNVIDYKPDADAFLRWLKERGYTLTIATTTKRSNVETYRARNGNMNGNMQRMTRYSENNLEFDIPEIWQAHFMSDVSNQQNANSSMGTYSTINFYYTGTSSPTKVMTVARFPKDSWAALNEQTPEAAKKKLGESADGKWIYSLTFEENISNDKGYTDVVTEAKKLKDKIKITD